MIKLLRYIVTLLENKERFVIATIFSTTGSAPRTAGAKMVICSDGSSFGTVGGGLLEASVKEKSREVLAARQNSILSFELTGRNITDMDMICGGRGEVFLHYIDGTEKTSHLLYQAALAALEQRHNAWIITAIDGIGSGRSCLVQHDKSIIGDLIHDQSLLTTLISGAGKIAIQSDPSNHQRFLVEPLRHSGVVYLFGAGHVSQSIAPLSNMVGFHTVVLDDRADMATRERFAEPTGLVVLEDYRVLSDLFLDTDSYIVIVTRGHLYDKTVLEWALKTDATYIGMIASRRKRDTIFAALIDEGFDPDNLSRVYSPIGLDIGAETPEEIAVSIVGELIKVRAERVTYE